MTGSASDGKVRSGDIPAETGKMRRGKRQRAERGLSRGEKGHVLVFKEVSEEELGPMESREAELVVCTGPGRPCEV